MKQIALGFRALGKTIDSLGRSIETQGHLERLVPSTRVLAYEGHFPNIKNSFVAPCASVIGQVDIGSNSSVWFGAVIRGDVASISIGENVTVGDRVMLHCNGPTPTSKASNLSIGNNVVVDPGAILHGCTVEEGSRIGANSQVMDGAVVQRHAILGPGSVVPQNKVIPSGQLWAGVPAVFQRNLTLAEKDQIVRLAAENAQMAGVYAEECDKCWEKVDLEQFAEENKTYMQEEGIPDPTPSDSDRDQGMVQGHQFPGRIFDSKLR